MVRDRMADLRASRSNSSTFGRGFLQDVHLQIAQNKKLKELLDEAEEIRDLIHLTVENVSIVKNLHNNILSHTSKDLQKELETRTCTISQTAFHVQRKLRDMGKGIIAIDDLTLAQDEPVYDVYTRIRTLQYTTMLQMFSDIMDDYNASLLKYHDKCLLLLQQQRSLLRRQVTSAELDYMLDAQETSLFVDNILEDSKIARQQLSDITNRHNDVLKLEKSLTEIKDMFTEIAFLVEKQGEQINNIEYFANKTSDNIDGGRVQLRKSEQRSHRYRKRKIKIAIIISIIVVICLLFIIASF
ncbi:PREDICTED: syntaxin-1A-like [Atta cephalotes]|uniref:t-SNARE coiled-coil homology domain-containing protein n=1 Tax=Atta cephalotes TaxID=12957 RepID=A0A158NCH1_ATTCE|nr:PREDICTED: syntaxin-1A-like [Atta cephalotes]